MIMRFGGILLILIGLLEMTGLWTTMVRWLQDQIGTFTPSL